MVAEGHPERKRAYHDHFFVAGVPVMLGWWVQQPPFLRTTVALVPLGVGGLCFLFGLWRWGLGLCVFGAVLLALSFPKPSEMRGYHD